MLFALFRCVQVQPVMQHYVEAVYVKKGGGGGGGAGSTALTSECMALFVVADHRESNRVCRLVASCADR